MPSPPVTFPCPFCGRKMGVPADLLGKQVRCPHCKQILVAPVTAAPAASPQAASPPPVVAASPPPPPPVVVAPSPLPPPPEPEPDLPVFNVPGRKEGADSILGEPEESDDEVFGSQGSNKLQMPGRPDPTAAPATTHSPQLPAAPQGAEGPAANPFEDFDTVTIPAGPAGTAPKPPPMPLPPPPVVQQPSPVLIPQPLPQPVQPTPQPHPRPVAHPLPVPQPVPAATPRSDANPFADFEAAPGPVLVDSGKPPRVPAPVAEELPDEPAPTRRKQKPAEPREPEERPAPATRGRPAPAGAKSNVLLFVVLGYAVLATGLAIYGLFFRSGGVPSDHPLSTIPDDFGEFPATDRKKVSQFKFPADGELPAAQRAKLGEKVTIGQLEIVPKKIEKRRLAIVTTTRAGTGEPRYTTDPALVLTLDIRNTGSLPIYPMDPAFTRSAKKDQPLTRLTAGKKTLAAGGHIDWPFEGQVQKQIEVQQANDWTPLGPNESREYVVFTEARRAVVAEVEGTKEPVQWRVQVRRGLIEFKGKEVPVTAIIGVDFSSADIKTPTG